MHNLRKPTVAVPFPCAYLNGEFLPLHQCRISPLDRGFLFADGVYEVIPVLNSRFFRLTDHLLRLQQSLDGIALVNPLPLPSWHRILHELVQRNGGGDQALYLQVTRGASDRREHIFPLNPEPTIFAMSAPLLPPAAPALTHGIRAITCADLRWQQCNIKSIALLANILARQQAELAGADEALLIRDDHVTEGSSSTMFAIEQNTILTPPINCELLPGITREVVLELAASHHIEVAQVSISEAQLRCCDEIWISSSTRDVLAVTTLDGAPVGNGRPGPLWQQMHGWFQAYKADPAAWQ